MKQERYDIGGGSGEDKGLQAAKSRLEIHG